MKKKTYLQKSIRVKNESTTANSGFKKLGFSA
ncbi:hypothetical protein Q361_1466 [Flavobacterium croceum DSM 17960]|uniref:Uncharacterized protein n=1 Tax=Flavobacterium croceum DSM 17960 TaxID=1121886 RepID=A0A2S4N4E8_9FLAO|nr:hypothetical protein Q361_1466 [Flavobacterium croceum DSM 17960]